MMLITAKVEDVATSITDTLADTQREIDTEKASLKTYVTERLASDDKILTALPGIVSKIVSEPEASEDEKSVEQWCKAIISFRTAAIKKRVDAVYLTSFTNHSPSNLPNASKEELLELKEALQAELESLHSEIASVAEMVVEHELRKPINEMKERKEREISQARSAWLQYVLSTLDYMGKRLGVVTEHTKTIDDFQQAVAHVSHAASSRLQDAAVEISSPARKRTTSGPKAPFSPAIRLKPSKALDLPPALADALRHAGVSFNQDNPSTLGETLLTTHLEREKKLQEHYGSSVSATHKSLAERLSRADTDLKAVLDALYSYTPFKQVHMTNPELEGELRKMERELENKGADILEVETREVSLSDPKVRAFVEKYGSK